MHNVKVTHHLLLLGLLLLLFFLTEIERVLLEN